VLTAAPAREVIDSAGRKVEVPDRIERIMAAGPPASVLVYMLAPEKMIGWNLKPREAELPFLAPMVRDLPEIGRLANDRACPHRYWRNGRHRIHHQRGSRRVEAAEGPASLRRHQGVRCHGRHRLTSH